MLKLLGLVAFSSVKFFWSIPAVVVAGYSFWETILITCFGGLTGFVLFFYIGELKPVRDFFDLIAGWFVRIFGIRKTKKVKRKFTRRNRFIIAVKGKYGLIGLSILTPSLFSIPLGSLLAARYFDKDRRTVPFMVISIILWSFLLTSISLFF